MNDLQLSNWRRRNKRWVFPLLLLTLFSGMFWFGNSYALAATNQPDLNQTVPPPPTAAPSPTAVPPTPAPTPTSRPSNNNQNPPQNNPSPTPVQDALPTALPETPADSATTVLTASVVAPVLNVREGPGTTFAIIGRLTSGAQVTVLARNTDGTWLNICCLPDTQTAGWISAQFVTPDYTPEQLAALTTGPASAITQSAPVTASVVLTGVVAVPSLNARAEPSTNAAILGRFTSGAPVAVLGRNSGGNWWLVCCAPSGGNAWVAAGFVRSDASNAVRATLPVVTGLDIPTSVAPSPATSPTPTPTASPETAGGTALTVTGPQNLLAAVQGEAVVLTFSVTNVGAAEAIQAEFSFELPAGLQFLSASATDGGDAVQVESVNGAPLVFVTWPELPVGVSATVQITANVDPALTDGSVLDGAAVAVADNAPSTYIPLLVGLPPVQPPDFQ